ncbi:bifunctional 2-polyprenyl-6-hydroxyphenol methylase/3-demethylubiquinol 3-O-methyltransferase UbiG [Mesorhizobium sp.]|uniref:class I SAM-dependent methyltransferase n=1 Tax=Mesorhizobium sp. TaxID=1871066 RepID=UPI0025DC3421|nr:class I SAM-dependent methyltransferase [Mesorhizobium sp.]
MQLIDSPLAVVRSVRSSIAGLRILDIGCGAGSFARQLVAEGADVSGIDPAADTIREAMAAFPQASFVKGVAESLPFGDAAFEIAVMVNALHHVPEMAMQAALGEAARVIKPNGVLIIVEPLATGNFFAALRLIEDESIVRQAAQLAIETAVLSGVLARVATLQYVRREVFRTVRGFLDRVVAVDPSRREVVEHDESGITAAVLAAAQRDSEGALIFDQPIKADILEPA